MKSTKEEMQKNCDIIWNGWVPDSESLLNGYINHNVRGYAMVMESDLYVGTGDVIERKEICFQASSLFLESDLMGITEDYKKDIVKDFNIDTSKEKEVTSLLDLLKSEEEGYRGGEQDYVDLLDIMLSDLKRCTDFVEQCKLKLNKDK